MVSAVSTPPSSSSQTAPVNLAGSPEGRSISPSKQLDPAAQQDRFLKLLVAQMNNQDPMNPVDNAQMTSQMAQINTVSGIQQLNDTMKGMSGQFGAMQLLQGASLVGKGVLVDSDKAHIRNGQVKGAIQLEAKAENVQVDVLNSAGKVIGQVDLGSKNAGTHAFQWDASQYQGSEPLTGPVRLRASAGSASNPLPVAVLAEDEVVSVGANKQDGLSLGLAENGTMSYKDIQAIQ
ncbi:flagellar hook assembly protein FlgD [Curvibacter sp. CHRR-16]|uniref:flagellar hook assembly protein FlgD n=1 Tax=Curvibacter sp. CHRR-16 TaxID=2835872 RepID=UPI001BDA754F|nr:flagellar hook capping FlgD N-terminal domain-containing protein [Curvibacter sp. CHRR-16]MBT0569548.1 flagellar hook assembly protein FlgD [Curvibacter sp. CHRR-16]